MTCGIYCLYFECDDEQFYIGESTNIENRYKKHCNDLIAHRHDNYLLQKYYKDKGLPSITIIESLPNPTLLKAREVYWISYLDTFNNGINLTIGGDGCGYGEVHPSSMYTKEQYVQVLSLLANTDKSAKEISTIIGVSYAVVIQISIGTTHGYLAIEFPTEYAKMLAKVGTRRPGTVSSTDSEAIKEVLDYLVYTKVSHKEIAEITNISIGIVKSISMGTSHADLKETYPVEYGLLVDRQNKSKYLLIERPKLISPSGEILEVGNNVTKFCLGQGLDQRAISAVLLGTRSIHKGWTLA